MSDYLNKFFPFNKLQIIVAIAFFFCMNQYNGILVDAILYTLQAVHFVHPERFINDASFMYGNQDSFTIFSPLYTFCINLFGVSQAALLLCFSSHLLFAISVSYLMYSWFGRFHCKTILFPSIILFFALYRFGMLRSAIYQFNIVEPYVVPRTFSVAFALLGIGNFYSSKIKALVFILLGFTFNPLMAGWALPLWIFFYYPRFIIPIVVCSALFPLTVFLGVGPFDRFDSEWLSTASKDFYLVHYVPFGLFYLWGTISFKRAFSLSKIFKALFFVWGIAFYWYAMAKVTGHIFLNQVQIFRMEWFCVTTTFLLMIVSFYRCFVVKFRKMNKLCMPDYFLFAFPLLLWIDSIFVDCCLIYMFLRVKGFQLKNADKVYFGLRILVISVLVFIGFMELCRVANINFFDGYQTKEYVRLAGFVGIIIIGWMYLSKKYSRRKAFFLLIIIAAATFSFERLQFEEKTLTDVAALAALTTIWINPTQRTRKRNMLLPLLWLIPYAIVHYDLRTEVQICSEKKAEMFWNKPIFENVVNRGKIWFITGGFHYIHPRFQFLTGAYIDNQYLAGGLLFRSQYIETMHRISMLFFEKEKILPQYNHRDFPIYWEPLYNADSLKKKFSFLCSHNEIRYLATDFDLDEQQPVDAYKFPDEDGKINLYQCP